MVSLLYYERRRATAELASDRNLRDAAGAHRQIYQAVRAHDIELARRAMNEHLLQSRSYQAKEVHEVQGSTFKVQRAEPKVQRPEKLLRTETTQMERTKADSRAILIALIRS